VTCANPIDISSGNKYEQVQDYATAGQNPLAFTRYYNSLAAPDTLATTLGSNWRSDYDRYLHLISSSAVEADRADGQTVNFTLVSGVWTPDTDVDYSLTYDSGTSTWTLTDPDDTVETYTGSGVATLQTIKKRGGYTQTMHYTSGKLSSVTDSYSRSLGLSYSSAGLLTGVTTPDTLALSYGYVAYSSAHLLTTVSYNTSPVTSQTYLYENTNYPFALTGITDENGNRFATWAYDASGRAISSQHAGGADLTQISYNSSTGDRTVTGPLGIVETYKFTALQGVPKVTEIDRAANGTVAAATRYFTYDSNGFLKTETDWNGNQTAYDYTGNAHGLPTTIVYASGSADSHTTYITYDGTWARLAATIATPGLLTPTLTTARAAC
jgi:YD repeat-containing protein